MDRIVVGFGGVAVEDWERESRYIQTINVGFGGIAVGFGESVVGLGGLAVGLR